MTGRGIALTEPIWSTLAGLDLSPIGHLATALAVLLFSWLLNMIRLEWFSRKKPDVRRDLIALREAERRLLTRGKDPSAKK